MGQKSDPSQCLFSYLSLNDWLPKSPYGILDSVAPLGGLSRAGNSGGTREPSSQKEFGFAESFFDFEVFTELNSKNVSEITAKMICFA